MPVVAVGLAADGLGGGGSELAGALSVGVALVVVVVLSGLAGGRGGAGGLGSRIGGLGSSFGGTGTLAVPVCKSGKNPLSDVMASPTGLVGKGE